MGSSSRQLVGSEFLLTPLKGNQMKENKLKENKVVDIGDIDTVAACNKGSEIELKHPGTKEPIGVFWGILGIDSDAMQDYLKEKVNENRHKEFMARKRGQQIPVSKVEDDEKQTIEMLLVVSTGWRSGNEKILRFNGEDLPFTIPNAKRVLTERKWIRTQINEYMDDIDFFMKS